VARIWRWSHASVDGRAPPRAAWLGGLGWEAGELASRVESNENRAISGRRSASAFAHALNGSKPAGECAEQPKINRMAPGESNVKPRNFLGSFLTLAGITSLPFALLWSVMYSAMMDLDFGQVLGTGIWAGIAFGVIFGFVMAFFLRAETISVPVQDRETFLTTLNIELAELGYHPESQAGDFFTFKPSFQAGLLAGKVSVQIRPGSATIVGPLTYVRKLRMRIL
jgi:hypothetical protein